MNYKKYDVLFPLFGAVIFLIPIVLIWYGYRSLLLPQAAASSLLGVLPCNDAHGYYDGALQYLDSGSLSYWNLRRPIHTLLFSSELFLTSKNYWYAMILQTFMCGLSCSLASCIVAKTLDKLAGIIFFIVSFILTLSFTPTTLTETTGVALGMLAFVFIWTGYISRQTITFSFGIFVLTLALHARAGPFFMLPCLILLAIFDFTKLIKLRIRILVFSSIAIISATYINVLLQKFFGDGSNQMHANFSYTIFGIVSGGKGWTYAYSMFPLSGMSEAEVASLLYKESLKTFLHNPFLIFLGFLKSLGGFIKFHLNFFHLYGVSKAMWSRIITKFVNFSFFCFCVYILKLGYCNKNLHRTIKFIVAGFIGIILSAMIIWQDGGIRVFATTYAFWAVAISTVYISYKYKNNISLFKVDISDKTFSQLKLISTLVLCYYFIAIAIIPFFSPQPQKAKKLLHSYIEKDTILIQNVAKYAYVVVQDNKNSLSRHKLREITRETYNTMIHNSIDPKEGQSFLNVINEKGVHQSFVIFAASSLYILANTDILQIKAPFLKLHGKSKNGFFIVHSYQPINP